LSKEQIDEYKKEAMSGDYDHLLATTMDYVDCDDDCDGDDYADRTE
jgi:hypothetical protein